MSICLITGDVNFDRLVKVVSLVFYYKVTILFFITVVSSTLSMMLVTYRFLVNICL